MSAQAQRRKLPQVDLKKHIETLIRNYCRESSKEPPYLKDLAKQHNVLPLYVDWSAFLGLRPDGEILVVPLEEEGDPKPENNDRLRRMALYRGSKKYPELSSLVPKKPIGALACPHCEGCGRINIPGVEPDTIICYCGGLGWLTQAEILADEPI